MKIVSTRNGEHYSWGDNCSGWHLLKSPGLSVIQESVPTGTGENLHYHAHAEQFFYVLAGKATLEVGGQSFSLAEGEGLHVNAGQPHYLYNHGPETLKFLVISAPPSHGDRIDL